MGRPYGHLAPAARRAGGGEAAIADATGLAGLRATVAAHLARHDRLHVPLDESRHAAVAVVLLAHPETGEPAFLLTKRPARMRRHAGQWALPGGRLDPGETAEQGALRECAEEVGLLLDPAELVGRLDDYRTRSGFVITPVVAVLDRPVELTPDPTEVAEVHRVPVRELDRPDSPRFVTIPESDRPVVQLPLLGHLIHAPTAAVLYQLREVALYGRDTRVAHLEQPVFAWR